LENEHKNNVETEATDVANLLVAPRERGPLIRFLGSNPVLIIFCILPALTSLVAVYLEFFQAVTYPLGKVLAIGGSIAIILAAGHTRKEILAGLGIKRSNCLPGILSGAILSAIILGLYYLFLKKRIDPTPIAEKVSSLGLKDYYWALALVTSCMNSLFEEYYWRAFIMSQLKTRISGAAALCLLGGALFGIHHFFVLRPMFPLASVLFLTFGTVVAGVVWSWMRVKGYSIFDCYISHLMADLAVFWAGWDMINDKLL